MVRREVHDGSRTMAQRLGRPFRWLDWFDGGSGWRGLAEVVGKDGTWAGNLVLNGEIPLPKFIWCAVFWTITLYY